MAELIILCLFLAGLSISLSYQLLKREKLDLDKIQKFPLIRNSPSGTYFLKKVPLNIEQNLGE